MAHWACAATGTTTNPKAKRAVPIHVRVFFISGLWVIGRHENIHQNARYGHVEPDGKGPTHQALVGLDLTRHGAVNTQHGERKDRNRQCNVGDENEKIWVAENEKGIYVALFNVSDDEREITFNFSEVQLSGMQSLRDVWKKEDLFNISESFSTIVAPHGAKMYLIKR